ncbi:HTH CENPB-type domain-containing protein [Trichonephila clavipes]|nr:HTH CENPB-type domain-containing protein [Trichonephila clavipes]
MWHRCETALINLPISTIHAQFDSTPNQIRAILQGEATMHGSPIRSIFSTRVGHNQEYNGCKYEEAKIQLKTALVYCEQLLLENNKIATEPSAVIKEEHMKIGEKLYSTIMETLAENIIVIEDDLILFEEADEEGLFEEVEDSGLQSDEEYHPDEKRSKIDTDDIPLDYKIKVVNLAKEHPKWSLKNLQKKGGSHLKRMDELKIWEEQIRRGGSTKDKYTTIDKWTHDRFVEARQSNQQVTTRNLQQWALAAASQFPDLEFKASEAWVKIFKRKHRIRQRKITKFVSERETATMEETHAAAEKFRLHTRALIPNYDKDFVLNTDQTGCQYQSTHNRTLAKQGSKVVLVKRKDVCVNKVTHSYTAQYVMSLSGKLLPTVFICLQEANGNFGPRVQKISRRVCENIYKRCHYILKVWQADNSIVQRFSDRCDEAICEGRKISFPN